MKLPQNTGDRLVYATGTGRICPDCGAPADRCTCKKQKPQPSLPNDGRVRVRCETKGRRGKSVTTIAGLPPGAGQQDMAARLKRLCGSGGTVKDGIIEIQGDHVVAIIEHLQRAGYKAQQA